MTEIFIEPELQELEQTEQALEWFEICTELGLEKQLKTADKSEEKKAPPYMAIDPKTSHIIRTLCPRVVEYKKYSASTIPLDVLREIQKVEKNGWYAQIQICYDDKSPDPFVIGLAHGDSNWDRAIHLIARWGGELLPFELLEEKAVARMKNNATEALLEMKFKVETALKNIDGFTSSLLEGKELPTINFKCDKINTWIS